jgi:hypothetical protein
MERTTSQLPVLPPRISRARAAVAGTAPGPTFKFGTKSASIVGLEAVGEQRLVAPIMHFVSIPENQG